MAMEVDISIGLAFVKVAASVTFDENGRLEFGGVHDGLATKTRIDVHQRSFNTI